MLAGQHPVAGRLRAVVGLADFAARTLLFDEFHRGREKIAQGQPGVFVEVVDHADELEVVEKLRGRGKWIREKAVIAAVIRKRTGVGNLWIARRLEMGHEGSVTRAVRWAREEGEGIKLQNSFETMLNY